MKKVVSGFLWVVSGVHFVICGSLLALAVKLLGSRRADPFLRLFARTSVLFAGIRIRRRIDPGYDRKTPCFLVANHVNIFDPWVLCTGVRRTIRGLELESHFEVPIYGWIMKGFGNVPIPDERTAAGLKRAYRLARVALDGGMQLLVFPEGSRTLDGRVGEFEDGAFRMARQLRIPIVPVSQVGAYERKRKGSKMMTPGTVTVIVHETIPAEEVRRTDPAEMRDRVRAIISGPVDEHARG